MSLSVLGIVLFAALLHASWNAVVKAARDRAVAFGLVALGHAAPAAIFVLFVPAPDPAAIPYIIASTVIHWGYYYFLFNSYRFGDLSLVYPIARGVAPVMIALGAVVWADETLPMIAWIGIGLVSSGLLLLAAMRRADTRGVGAALLTSTMIAAYSIVDGLGIRLSGSPVGYVAWLFMLELIVAVFLLAPRRTRLISAGLPAVSLGMFGGIISGLAYGLALYAKTLAPLGVVSAIRETSVIFAALIGVIWFGEGPARPRIIASCVVAAGVALLAVF